MPRFVLDKKKGKGGDYLGEWREHDFHGENPLIWRDLRRNGVGVMREEGRRFRGGGGRREGGGGRKGGEMDLSTMAPGARAPWFRA